MFEMVGVDVFRDWLLDLCMDKQIQWISCVKVLSIFLFRLNVRNVGRMNTQVWLLNSLVRLAGWVAEWTANLLARCVTWNGRCSIQYRMAKFLLKCLTLCLFPLLTRIRAEWQNVACQNHRNHAWKLQSLPESQNRAITECLEIKMASAVNQICRFGLTKSSRNLTVA